MLRNARSAHIPLITLILILFTGIGTANLNAQTSPPAISGIVFPEEIPDTGESIEGSISFEDADGDISEVEFNLLDGDSDTLVVMPGSIFNPEVPGLTSGDIPFSIASTTQQNVSFEVILSDLQGSRSDPLTFEFVIVEGVPLPFLETSASSLAFETTFGRDPADQKLTISNTGGRSLRWRAESSDSWISLFPPSSSLEAGESSEITVQIRPGNLSLGSHAGSITITSTEAANSPLVLEVSLAVTSLLERCGDEIYADDFNDTLSGWLVTSGAGFDWGYTGDGDYRVFITAAGFAAWSWAPLAASEIPSQYCLELDAVLRVAGSLSAEGEVGLFFGGSESDRTFTMFSVIPDYSLYHALTLGSNGFSERVDYSLSFAINGPNETNRLVLVAEESRATIFINGSLVETIPLSTAGQVGVFSGSFSEPNVNGRFEKITIREFE